MSTSALLSDHRSRKPSGDVFVDPVAEFEAIRARRHPLSRWYICPLASRFTARLVPGLVRPWQLSLTGLACGILAFWCVASQIGPPAVAAMLVLAAWFFDRADGILARRLGTSDRNGAWLDANTDEIIDLGLQSTAAVAAARATGSHWPYIWLVVFLLSKYLFMHGMSCEWEDEEIDEDPAAVLAAPIPEYRGWLHWLYHLPGNADVRVHLLVAALLTGWLTEQLAVVALYYSLRWIVRYVRGLKLAVEAST